MPPKPSQKVVKKRKFLVDPSQNNITQYLASSSSSEAPKNDPMVIDSPSVNNEKSNVLGTVRQQSLTPSIVIANAKPSRAQQLPDSFFETSWEIQQELIKEIFGQTPSIHINYITVSKSLESLCRYGKSEEIFERLEIELKNHVSDMKQNSLSNLSKDNILGRLRDCWDTYCHQLAIIRNIFMELDRSYILTNTKFTSIIQLGKHIFSNTVLSSSEFRDEIVEQVLVLIKLDRDNQNTDIKLIQSILQMLIELSYYSSEFEAKFLANTNTYYKQESDILIKQLETSEYIQHAFDRRSQEINERIKLYLDLHTKQPLSNVVTNQLIYSKTEEIINKGFDQMMNDNLVKPLKIFYDLLLSNPKISLLRHAFGEYIKTKGVLLIKNPQSDTNMVVEILKFKARLDQILKQCFDNDTLFQNALKESFEYFMNTRGNRPAELIARFLDSKLKLTSKKQSKSNDINITIIDNVLSLFRYIQGKDAFEAYYKRFLAKRLLMDRCISTDLENYVLDKLKAECGHEFTKNLDSMIKDIKSSNELDESFSTYKLSIPRIPIVVKVVSQAIWPTFPTSEIVLPPQMVKTQALYNKFYTSKNSGKKLIWQNFLSTCIIQGHFLEGTKELIVSTSQAAILLLFNDHPTLKQSEISKATNLNKKELSRLITSISTGNYNFLIPLETDDIYYTFNFKFKSKSNIIRVPPPMIDQTVEEQKVEEKVFKNRQHQIDAAIIRIMKSKKTASHEILVNEVITQLNYPAETMDIKKRIESLIEKYYLIRDTTDASVYIYQN